MSWRKERIWRRSFGSDSGSVLITRYTRAGEVRAGAFEPIESKK